jgi:hypothetical protein
MSAEQPRNIFIMDAYLPAAVVSADRTEPADD